MPNFKTTLKFYLPNKDKKIPIKILIDSRDFFLIRNIVAKSNGCKAGKYSFYFKINLEKEPNKAEV